MVLLGGHLEAVKVLKNRKRKELKETEMKRNKHSGGVVLLRTKYTPKFPLPEVLCCTSYNPRLLPIFLTYLIRSLK